MDKNNKNKAYVGRGALKLKYALEQFGLDINNKTAVDLGSSTGGFTEVLLEKGAKRVYAVDTAYGQLAWKLRGDKRVVVMERTNALYLELPEKVDLAVIDVGWTAQRMIIPRAAALLKPGGQIVSLVKPHYEAGGYGIKFKGGRLAEGESEIILQAVINDLKNFGLAVKKFIRSPITGGKGGNTEYFIWIKIK